MPRVLGYALRRADSEVARDAVSETFTIAWRRLEAVPDGDGTLPWLLGTTRRVLANERRRLRASVIQPVADRPDLADDVVERAALAAAFNRLSDRDRETLALVAWDGLSTSEAARVAGCSAGTFAVRLHRARRHLGAMLAAEPSPMSREEPA
jgi:RNA polymerase sigma-70 factor (ECF subfamily)